MMKRLLLTLAMLVAATPALAQSYVWYNAINDTITSGDQIKLSAGQSGVGGHQFCAESTAVLNIERCDFVNLFLRLTPVAGDTTTKVTLAIGIKAFAREPWASGFADSLDSGFALNTTVGATAAIADTTGFNYTTYAFATTNRSVFPGEFLLTLSPWSGYGSTGAAVGGITAVGGGGDQSPRGWVIPLSLGRSSPTFHSRFIQIRIRVISAYASLTTKTKVTAHVECVDTN